MRLAADPLTAGRFSGWIEHVPVGNPELSAVVAGSQHVRRTRSFIAQENETLFSNDRLEGVAHLAGTLSGEVAEHAYWGGARDRLPLAQTDPLAPGDPPGGDRRRHAAGGPGPGQPLEPVLRAGMDFLRDEGRTVGCYANRYLHRGRSG